MTFDSLIETIRVAPCWDEMLRDHLNKIVHSIVPEPKVVQHLDYMRSLDAVYNLHIEHTSWLHPELNFHEGSCRLVNGIVLPVGGKDYKVVGSSTKQAYLASTLLALRDQGVLNEANLGVDSEGVKIRG